MAFLDFLTGTPAQTIQVPRLSPQQMSAQNTALQTAVGGLQQPQNTNQRQFDFAPIAQRARTNFQQQTIPSIAERFTAMGANRSSAYPAALGAAGSGLDEALAALEAQYNHQREGYDIQRQGQQNNWLQNLLQLGLGSQFDTIYQPEQQGFLQGGAESLLKILPILASAYFGGAPAAIPGLLGALGSQSSRIGSFNTPSLFS